MMERAAGDALSQGAAAEFRSLSRLSRQASDAIGGTRPFSGWLARLTASTSQVYDTNLALETCLEELTRDFRRIALGVAHGIAEHSPRSPLSEETGRALHGGRVDFGYERDMAPQVLERRLAAQAPEVPGWHSFHTLCSSGQAAMAVLASALMATHETLPLRLLHCGRYFETMDLMRLLGTGGRIDYRLWQPRSPGMSCDVVLVEPVYVADGQFACIGIDQMAAILQQAQPRSVVIDATLLGPLLPLANILQHVNRETLVVVIRSCLKLDQAGLELANAGSLSLYYDRGRGNDCGALQKYIGAARSLIGAGLSFEAINALSYPWCFSRRDWQAYCARIFRHNRMLGAALAGNDFFLPQSHPQQIAQAPAWAQAPFCCLRPRDARIDCTTLADELELQASRIDVKFDRGGSFGFRGHRFDLIVPEDGSPAFLRVALGARGGSGLRAILALLADFRP